MRERVKRVGLVSRTDLEAAVSLARDIHRELSARGVECLVEDGLASRIGVEGSPLDRLDVDLAVVIGGDGTILRAARRLPSPDIPILGVRMGKTCFLGEVDPEQAFEAIGHVLSGRFEVERALRLRASVRGLEVDVVNEALLTTSQPAKVVRLKVEVDGVEVFSGLADGVMASTPTGSTGYALSAHGPIVDPEVEAYLLVYLNPLDLRARPMVVAASRPTRIEVVEPGPKAILVADGEEVAQVEGGEVVEVRRSPSHVCFARLRGGSFFTRLRSLMDKRSRGLS